MLLLVCLNRGNPKSEIRTNRASSSWLEEQFGDVMNGNTGVPKAQSEEDKRALRLDALDREILTNKASFVYFSMALTVIVITLAATLYYRLSNPTLAVLPINIIVLIALATSAVIYTGLMARASMCHSEALAKRYYSSK